MDVLKKINISDILNCIGPKDIEDVNIVTTIYKAAIKLILTRLRTATLFFIYLFKIMDDDELF